jgi:hypothetical protein
LCLGLASTATRGPEHETGRTSETAARAMHKLQVLHGFFASPPSVGADLRGLALN